MSEHPEPIEAREHYAYVTRSAIRLFNEGKLSNVVGIDVEPEYGYTARLEYSDGSYRVTYGNDLGLNTGAAEDLAKDKGHTKFLLRKIGIHCPEGREFLLQWWAETIGETQVKKGNNSIHTVNEAADYIHDHLGYPVYVKPVAGSKGSGVRRVESDDELSIAIDELEESKSRVAVIEEDVKMPDYRVVMLDGELISAYQRIPLSVAGDGRKTVGQLLNQLQQDYDQAGRDTIINADNQHIIDCLNKQGMDYSSVPRSGETVVLADVSNLSKGGTSQDVSDVIHNRWIELCAYIAENFNLRLCGVDLACEDITTASSNYSVLEVNAAPGLDHYALSGEPQQKIVDEMYVKVLNAFPSR